MTKYNTEKEIWKDVIGYEGLYEVSNHGNVKSLPEKRWNGQVYFMSKEIILKPNPQVSGYLNVQLYKNKVKQPFAIHRLVAKHFIKNPESKEQVNHLDGVKTNNHVSNLEWATSKENVRHSIETGLWNPHALKGQGGRKVEQYSLDGEYIKTYPATTIAGEQFGKHASSSIARACRGEYETSYGYKWKYADE